MAENLLDAARRYLGSATAKSASTITAEPPQRTERALDVSNTAIFAGFVNESSREPSLTHLYGLLKGGQADDARLSRLSETLADSTQATELAKNGGGILGQVFRDRLPAVVDHVATTSGVSRGNARTLLAIAAPVATGVLGRTIAANNLGPSDLQRLLAGHRPAVESALGPAGTSLFFEDARTRERVVQRPVVTEAPVVHEKKRSSGLWIALGLMGLVGILGLLATRGERVLAVSPEMPRPVDVTPPEVPKPSLPEPAIESPTVAPPSAPAEPAIKPEAPMPAAPMPAAPSRAAVMPLGDGAGFIALFQDPKATLPQRFVVSGFAFAKDTTPGGNDLAVSADAIAATMKANPGARIRIDGYTDDRGDPDANKALSLERAMNFRKMLVQRGVSPDAIALLGKGAENPMSPNTTDDGRAANRRVEVVVMHK